MQLTVGSLFSGIGGLDLGLERAGMKVIWQCESDPYARRVLAKHFPGAPCYGDVRNVGGDLPDAYAPERVDVLCGGFPCQDISVAGKGAGIKEGTRSGLWIEFARIIRELMPRYVLVENVPALRSRGLNRVLGDLAAIGYDAEWECISASSIGAPHRRDRVFIVAYPNGQRRGSEGNRQRRGIQNVFWHTSPEETRRAYFQSWSGEPIPRSLEPDMGRVADGVPGRLDRIRCLGNAVVPQVAELIGRCIVAHAEAA